jgi:hypothetical protein
VSVLLVILHLVVLIRVDVVFLVTTLLHRVARIWEVVRIPLMR